MRKISIAITCYNQWAYTDQALRSALKTVGGCKDFECRLALFDDCSTDSTQEKMSGEFSNVFYYRSSRNIGLTALWNSAYQTFKSSDILFIVNNDVIFPSGWLRPLVEGIMQSGADMVGPITNGPGHIAEQDVRNFIPNYRANDDHEHIERTQSKLSGKQPFQLPRINGFCLGFDTNFLATSSTTSGRNDEPFDPSNRNFGNEDEIQDRMSPLALAVPSSFVFHYKRISITGRPRGFSQYRRKSD